MLEVAIFSYNRVEQLRIAVDSARTNLPGARIRVFDDRSTDPAMLAYLDSLGEMVVPADENLNARHGGLYANMQRAFELAEGRYLLMLQDDVQVVRPVDSMELDEINTIFASDPHCAFLSVLFMRGRRMRRYRRQLAPDPVRNVYDAPSTLSPRNFGRRLAYYDICLWNVERLRAAGWRVLPSEGANAIRARELFSTMPVMKNPFVFFCPEVPFFRHRSQTWAARLAGRFVGRHAKFYHVLTSTEVKRLRSRPMDVWPRAEDFLRPLDPKVVRPFVFKDVQARWWLYALHKIEQAFRHR